MWNCDCRFQETKDEVSAKFELSDTQANEIVRAAQDYILMGLDRMSALSQCIHFWSKTHRRIFATVSMDLSVIEEIASRLLNHTPILVTGQRYMRPSIDAMRHAMIDICVA